MEEGEPFEGAPSGRAARRGAPVIRAGAGVGAGAARPGEAPLGEAPLGEAPLGEGPGGGLSPRVRRRLVELAGMERLPYPTLPDGSPDEDGFAQRCDEMQRRRLALAHEPCATLADAAAKLTLLCRTLREEVTPGDAPRLIAYLLAENVRDALTGALPLAPPLDSQA